MAWIVELLTEAEAELLRLPADVRARFLHIAELLGEFGPHKVGMPHVRQLDGKLWEMRMIGRDGIARAVYVARTWATPDGVAHLCQENPTNTEPGHRNGRCALAEIE